MLRVICDMQDLRLDLLNDDWVQGIYYSEFLEFGEFPSEYESHMECQNMRRVFKRIMKSIDAWLAEESDEEKSWSVLSPVVPHQKLLAILAYYIDHGSKNVITKEYRNNALLASRLYYKLLAVSGYKAYNIYHSQLFAQSLGCLSFPKGICDSVNNRYNAKDLLQEVNSVIKGLRYFVLDLRAIIGNLQLGPSDMNFEDILNNLVDVLGGAIVSKLSVDTVELTNIFNMIYHIIDVVIYGSTLEPNTVTIKLIFKCILPKLVATSIEGRNAGNSLVRASYAAYTTLLISTYGKPAMSAYITLLQHLCYAPDGLERGEVRQARVEMVDGQMTILPRKAYRKMVKWVLTLSTTARVSHRQFAIELLAKLLTTKNPDNESPKLDQESQQTENMDSNKEQLAEANQDPGEGPSGLAYQDSGEGTLSLAYQDPGEGPSGLAYQDPGEGTSGLAYQDPGEGPSGLAYQDPGEGTSGQAYQDPGEGPSGVVYQDPGEDTSGLVYQEPGEETSDLAYQGPGEGTSGLAYEDPGEEPTCLANQSQPHAVDQMPTEVPDSMAAEYESSQDSLIVPKKKPLDPESSRQYFLNLLRERPHVVPYVEILHALYDRAEDASATVRARVITMLADCVHSKRPAMQAAIKELNGSGEVSRLMAVAARGINDDRAAVRRAALLLVHRSLTAPNVPEPPSKGLGILISKCCDASVIVRSSAMTALAELVVERPGVTSFDAFLSGPMHQLSDPESKVQELVLSLVQQLLIDRLQKYTVSGCDDQLPWLYLAAIARNNMRKHLQKTCTMLAKGSCINHRLVDILSTHLGVADDARDLHCLIMLTSIARHVDCNDVAFVLVYYYTLSDDTTARDARLMPLTLELLTIWSRWASTDERTALREHLVKRLAGAEHDGCRLARATLAAHLAPNNLTWATELLQLAERSAMDSPDVEEWVRAADLSLVAPEPPSPALLRIFLAAIATPPKDWSAASVGSSVAGCGRLCVRSREAAAAAAPTLAAALIDTAAPQGARINALLMLTDICTRYTCIVEPLLESVCTCLSPSTDTVLRRAAARAVTRLMLSGYLRLRTPLYYRFCMLLVDTDHDVREPAEYYMTSCISPEAIYNHFVDCLLFFNRSTENISYDDRHLIYDIMLQRLSVVQRLNLQCRLAREVLVHAADVTDEGDGEIPPDLNSALLDAISLLCGQRMKLPTNPQRDEDEADIDDLHSRVTTNIVSHKMKRTVAEVLVPAILRLYMRVGARGGQIAVYLVRIANDMLFDYRDEIQDMFDNDRDLVERVRMFQETIGIPPSFGNSRNLVTTSTPHEPETPRAPRKRGSRAARSPPRKRALRI